MNDNFMNLTIVTENKELSKRMNIIQKEMNGVLKSANVIGKALCEIKAQELWKDTYKSFEECAGIFGIKKVQAYNLIKGYEIGEKRLIRKDNGNHEKMCAEYSNTQCVEIAKLKDDKEILRYLDEGLIKPSMSTKQIRDVIDHNLHPEKYIEKEAEAEAEAEEKEAEAEEKDVIKEKVVLIATLVEPATLTINEKTVPPEKRPVIMEYINKILDIMES